MNTQTATPGYLYKIPSYTGESLMFLVQEVAKDGSVRGARFVLSPITTHARFLCKEERDPATLQSRVGKLKRHVIRAIERTGSASFSSADVEKN